MQSHRLTHVFTFPTHNNRNNILNDTRKAKNYVPCQELARLPLQQATTKPPLFFFFFGACLKYISFTTYSRYPWISLQEKSTMAEAQQRNVGQKVEEVATKTPEDKSMLKTFFSRARVLGVFLVGVAIGALSLSVFAKEFSSPTSLRPSTLATTTDQVWNLIDVCKC